MKEKEREIDPKKSETVIDVKREKFLKNLLTTTKNFLIIRFTRCGSKKNYERDREESTMLSSLFTNECKMMINDN
jgi:hypothetical protein